MSLSTSNQEAARAEEAWVRRSQDGDLSAFSQLVEACEAMCMALAFSACGDRHEAQDLVQEALVQAWTRLDQLRDPKRFRPWLARILRNAAHRDRRHRGRHAPRAEFSIDDSFELCDPRRSPHDALEERETWESTRRALESLPARYRETLMLYFVLDESYAAVASSLGMSEVAVRKRVSRARKLVRDALHGTEALGRGLRASAGLAALAVLAIEKRRAFAAPLVAPEPGLWQSPSFFVGVGALAGSAVLLCVAAVALLLHQGSSRAAAMLDAPALNLADEGEEATRAVQAPPPASADAQPAADPHTLSATPQAEVRMGRGRVRPPREGASRDAREHRAIPSASRPSQSGASRSRAGYVKKHGPAQIERRVLLKPSIDFRDVQRELWSY